MNKGEWCFTITITLGLCAILFAGIGRFVFAKDPLFTEGDIVKTVIGGHSGMIVRNSCEYEKCYYSVRFSSPVLSTQSHLIGSGGDITTTPMQRIDNIREYELEAAK